MIQVYELGVQGKAGRKVEEVSEMKLGLQKCVVGQAGWRREDPLDSGWVAVTEYKK